MNERDKASATPRNGSPGSECLEEIVADYLDLLNAGKELDPLEIAGRYPDQSEAILQQLYAFLDLGRPGDSNEPLGTLGDYTLRRQIGRGGMGVVYEAWQGSLDRQVALKVLPAGIAVDDKAFHRFMREAKTAAKLNHQNVVGVYGMGVEQDTPYYSMEYVEGETLAQILSRIKDSEADTETPFGKKDDARCFLSLANAFADVADGLQHAHSKGVTHRDVKPSNLILDSDGRLRILDFGLARLEGQESLTLSGDFVGTPLYMSPEQARRKKIPVDHRTDVYSLGATMYEAICGRPPFRGKDHADTLSQIIERDPVEPRKLNPRVPGDLETIVLKCLHKVARDRYGTAEALAQDLRRFVRGDPIEARPLSNWQRLSSQLRRHRVALLRVSIVVTAVCVITWLGATIWQAQREKSRLELKSRINAHLDDGRWAAAVELGREVTTADEEDVEAYLLLGTALKHDLSVRQTTAAGDSVLEFLKVARRGWKLAPDDRDARFLLKAARETAALSLARAPNLQNSRAIESALANVTALLPSRLGPGDQIVEDFVADADLRNSSPLSWHHIDRCPGESEPSPDGDGLDVWQTVRGSFLFATDEVFSGDVCVGSRAILHGTRFGMFGLMIHGGPGVTGYIGRVRASPEELGGSSVEITKWRRGHTVRTESGNVSITAGEELQLELCSTLAGVELRVWHPGVGEERPVAANVTMDDTQYSVGSVGFGGHVPLSARSKGATLRLRSFSVTVLR